MAARGFLYAATGGRWIDEAVGSAARAHRIHPDIPAVLFTDDPDRAAEGPFADVVAVPPQGWSASEVKVWALSRTPFDRTVFLDSDTHVIADVGDLFTVLDRYDIAGAPEPGYKAMPGHTPSPEIPAAFQPVNTGVLAYRRSDTTDALLADWLERYRRDQQLVRPTADQPSFRAALWHSGCQFLLLPAEYNMRSFRHHVLPTVAAGPVRIVHGRPSDVDALARRWNGSTELRLLTPLAQYVARQVVAPVSRRFPRNGRVRRATHRFRWRFAGR